MGPPCFTDDPCSASDYPPPSSPAPAIVDFKDLFTIECQDQSGIDSILL